MKIYLFNDIAIADFDPAAERLRKEYSTALDAAYERLAADGDVAAFVKANAAACEGYQLAAECAAEKERNRSRSERLLGRTAINS